MKMVMGGETEYAISARDASGDIVDQGVLLDNLLEHATRYLGYTSQSRRGRFLGNGGLLYLDAGLHMEWATPECTSPFDVVRYLKAGDRIVYDVAVSFKNRWRMPRLSEVFCSRSNVDYLSGTLWAAHESYMHDASPADLPAQLTPFLASRVILGAGGWDSTCPGLRFTMSPRAHFITTLADKDSQYVRPIFHTKNEALSCTGSHRLHVACSETLCSETANVLRFGTTALVLTAVALGARPGSSVTLSAPIRSIKHFAANLQWRAATNASPRQWLTALEIQRHYLSCVELWFDERRFPAWTERVCRLWRAVLDDLEGDQTREASLLDWAIKRRLFERQLARRGIAWSSLRHWNRALERLAQTWRHSRLAGPFEIRHALERSSRLANEQTRLAASLAREGIEWSQLAELDAARKEVFELDARFGALGDGGIFNALEAAGAIRHQVGLNVDDAMTKPPQDTRARIRGDVVRRLSDAGISYGAEWTGVHDWSRKLTLDLHDPFESEERWSTWNSREPILGSLSGA
jgi:proteasome accessory factor A